MKKIFPRLLALLLVLSLAACSVFPDVIPIEPEHTAGPSLSQSTESAPESTFPSKAPPPSAATEEHTQAPSEPASQPSQETQPKQEADTTTQATAEPTQPPTEATAEPTEEPTTQPPEDFTDEENRPVFGPDPDGSYTTKEDVAWYIHFYGCLPPNFMTKSEARALGWSGGSLEPYAPGMCIGGDRFQNREGLLPKASGRYYTECDIDTLGADSRGAERIVFSNDGLIYYTADHYASFTLLYGEP